MNHISLDLETLGTRAGCVILSIGAVGFDPHTRALGPKIYITINQKSCEAAGLTVDRGTLGWWMRQSEEARAVLHETRSGGVTLQDALEQLSSFMRQFGSEVRPWTCGASFDLPILSHAYAAIGKRPPWKYTNERCYRTLKSIIPTITIQRGAGTHHNALDDAIAQAEHAMQIMGRITEALRPAP